MHPIARFGRWLQNRAGPKGAFAAGVENRRLGRLEAAAEAFEAAERGYVEELGPASRQAGLAMENRAWCYVKLDRMPEAIRLYELAIANEDSQDPVDDVRMSVLLEQLEWATAKR